MLLALSTLVLALTPTAAAPDQSTAGTPPAAQSPASTTQPPVSAPAGTATVATPVAAPVPAPTPAASVAPAGTEPAPTPAASPAPAQASQDAAVSVQASDASASAQTPPVETAPAADSAPAPEKAKLSDPIVTPLHDYIAGKGFHVASEDERFSMTIRARVQVRYDLDHRNDDEEIEASGEDASEHLLQVRRARLQFQGNVFGKHNKYYMQLGFSPADQIGGVQASDGSIRRGPLRDFRMEFDYLRDATVWVGQMKVPFSRQRVVSSGNMNLVDRSLTNAEFQLDRDIGLQVLSKDLFGLGNVLGYNLGIFGGQGRNAFEPTKLSALYVARVEVRPFGKFDDYSEGDLARQKKPKLSIGAAYAFHDEAKGTRSVHGRAFKDGGDVDYHHFTSDLVFHWRGASLQGAFHLRKGTSRDSGGVLDSETNMAIATEKPHNGLGWFAQAGYLLPKVNLEFVGRYSNARKTGGSKSALNDQTADSDEAVFGLNYYFYEHNLKLQADYSRVWRDDGGRSKGDNLSNGRDRVRVQIQMAF